RAGAAQQRARFRQNAGQNHLLYGPLLTVDERLVSIPALVERGQYFLHEYRQFMFLLVGGDTDLEIVGHRTFYGFHISKQFPVGVGLIVEPLWHSAGEVVDQPVVPSESGAEDPIVVIYEDPGQGAARLAVTR